MRNPTMVDEPVVAQSNFGRTALLAPEAMIAIISFSAAATVL
jgi:hypothetical protein